jgi:soluble cytochrome b562
MSTIDATVSMLETMPVEAQEKVFSYTQALFSSRRPANPFTPKSEAQILTELDKSEQEIAEGKCQEATTAVTELRRAHGFI